MDTLSSGVAKIWASLGRCGLCMRKAFQTAAMAWCFTLALWLLGVEALWQGLAMGLAFGVTLLWLSHLIAFSVKTQSRPPCGKQAVATTRREAIRRFANTFAFIAVSTAIPAFSQTCSECPSETIDGNVGWGPCGSPCRLRDGRSFPCQSCERPVTLRNGDCVCCGFRC